MGLRCLLGHDFSEPELRREREEDGSEVVTTVTEVKTCARCGETQIVSENTEVTTMEQLADEAAAGAEAAATATETEPTVSGDRAAAGSPEHGAAASGTGSTAELDPGAAEATVDRAADAGPDDAANAEADDDADADADDAVIIDDDSAAAAESGGAADAADTAGSADTVDAADTAAAADATADEPAAAEDEGAEVLDAESEGDEGSLGGGEEYAEYPEVETAESEGDDERDAETDDGVILDESDEQSADRDRGAWPEVDEADDTGGAATPWPEQRGEDEGFSAEVGDGDAGAVEFGGGLTPEAAEPTAEDADAEYVEAPERDAGEVDGTAEQRDEAAESADSGTGITRGESPELRTSASEAATEYRCPECGMRRDADGNSMRAGDICPECKRGYVTERPI
jgi:predicted RNA-binding Zn-ribbon protein involved in translation (DUF1610 family)